MTAHVCLVNTSDELGRVVADRICDVIGGLDKPVLGLATGGSPLPIYQELVERHRAERVSFRHTQAFLLDEYVGLPSDDPRSFRSYIHRELADHVDFAPGHVFGPAGDNPDLEGACEAYESAIIGAGGIDLQLLGIGRNGHIGFNEPGSDHASRCRVVMLAPETRMDNAAAFDGRPPIQAVTLGVGTILQARSIVLVALGAHKARAVAAALRGPVSAVCPASALQLHRDTTFVIDHAAASKLSA